MGARGGHLPRPLPLREREKKERKNEQRTWKQIRGAEDAVGKGCAPGTRRCSGALRAGGRAGERAPGRRAAGLRGLPAAWPLTGRDAAGRARSPPAARRTHGPRAARCGAAASPSGAARAAAAAGGAQETPPPPPPAAAPAKPGGGRGAGRSLLSPSPVPTLAPPPPAPDRTPWLSEPACPALPAVTGEATDGPGALRGGGGRGRGRAPLPRREAVLKLGIGSAGVEPCSHPGCPPPSGGKQNALARMPSLFLLSSPSDRDGTGSRSSGPPGTTIRRPTDRSSEWS